MIRIKLKPIRYSSPSRLEQALREAVAQISEEPLGLVQCRSCQGWFAMDADEARHDDPPVAEGRFWKIKSCDECRQKE